MIIFVFLGAVIIGLMMLATGLILKWVSGLISPWVASLTGRDVVRVEGFIQTTILLAITAILFFASQKSCSYGYSFHNEAVKVVSIEEIGYVGLGWILVIVAMISLGAAGWYLKIAVYGRKPKDERRKTF